MLVKGDADVRQVQANRLVDLMARIVLSHHLGTLKAPPRIAAAVGDGQMVFTVGGTPDLVGFRAYGRGGAEEFLEQVVTVYDRKTGRLLGVVVGGELGVRRTAGLGALACKLLSRPDSNVLGLIGTGPQAWAHVWALNAVRPLEEVSVFSRSPDRRQRFAERCRGELAISAHAVQSAEDAVRDCSLVTLATTSGTPVISADWISPGCHLATLGPKTLDSHEIPAELVSRCSVIATDSPRQLAASSAGSILSLLPGKADQVRSLGQLMQNGIPRRPDDVTMFCSVGLAGSEVILAAEILGFPSLISEEHG